MSKIDFITDLLNDKRIAASQKERLFQLISREIENFEVNDNILFHEIEIIKQKIGIESGINDALPPTEEKKEIEVEKENAEREENANNLPEYLPPLANTRFLSEFSQNTVLNSITHLIDNNHEKMLLDYMNISEYNFKRHLETIKKEFNKLNTKYYNRTSKGLFEKISAYINGTNQWSNDQINFSWSDAQLNEWAKKNPGKIPNPDDSTEQVPFTFNKRIDFKYRDPIRNMNELVLHFKDQITIRGANNLEILSKRWLYKILEEKKINLNIEDIDKRLVLNTDVEKLGQAIVRIIHLCIQINPDIPPQINLSFKHKGDCIVFGIHHLNSIYTKPVKQAITNYGTTYSGLINKLINGLCDLELTADFGNNEYSHLTLWPQTGENHPVENFRGVLHELIFYTVK